MLKDLRSKFKKMEVFMIVKLFGVIAAVIFMSMGISVFAADNATLPDSYMTTNITATSPLIMSQDYTHTYEPNSSIKERVNYSSSVSTVGIGVSRINDMLSTASTGDTYISSFVGYKSIEPDSYMSAENRMGAESCCSCTSFCGDLTGSRVASDAAFGYSLNKLTDGYVAPSMTYDPNGRTSVSYNIAAYSKDDNGDLNTGTEISSSSADYSQSYSRHIHVKGEYIMYNSAQIN
jgi:hypothetical protein